MARYRGRFAPSPTGNLHWGSLLTAWVSWIDARQQLGEWCLRIDDIDQPREVSGAAIQQIQTLSELGLVSDQPIIWQRQRSHLYQHALENLFQQNRAFYCQCSRSDLLPQQGIHHRCGNAFHFLEKPPLAQNHFTTLKKEILKKPAAVRLNVPPELAPISFSDRLQGRFTYSIYKENGDFVLKRADGYWAYQLASVVDDAEQGVTDIVRGGDLLDSTAKQIFLQHQLGYSTPNYLHLPLVVDDTGKKLSKSEGAWGVQGISSLQRLKILWCALGQPAVLIENCCTISECLEIAVKGFNWQLIPRQISVAHFALHKSFVL